MSVLKVGVVEDELIIARTILQALEELGYTHCGPAISYTEAISMLETDKPDLLLVDIQLAGKKDGIDLAQQLNGIYKLPYIFLTANSDPETVERAKKAKPHAYIVKPFTKDELYAAVEIAFSNYASGQPVVSPSPLAAYRSKEHLFVRDGYLFRKVSFSELSHLESDANYVTLHLASQKKVVVRSTLLDMTAQLDPGIFIRVHRSYSVNIHLVEEVSPTDLLVNGARIPVGKSYRNDLLKALGISEA